MNAKIDFKTYGDFTDAKTFLAKRAEFINSSNDKLSALHKEVKSGLLIMEEESGDEIILHSMPLKGLVFREVHDLIAYKENTYSHHGEYPIDTIEVYYGEYIRAGETRVIKWCKINMRGTQPDKTRGFCMTNGFDGWEDNTLFWGKNCVFLYRKDYLLFKKTITKLGKDLGIIKGKK